ncbi:MAG: ABC transporter permease [Verrucomicrobia bacterium]|nr:ABC transporter permease [Verrucomicrobiota bacterium]
MNTLRTIWLKLRSLRQRDEVKQEIDEELRFHLDQRTAENIAAGMSPEEAAREARKRFGNLQSVREECRERRGASFGETMWQDVRFGLRMLRKSPGFTAVAVLTLALGIGVNTAIFSLVEAVLLRPLPFPEPDRLVDINESHRKDTLLAEYGVSFPNFKDWQAQSRSFASMGIHEGWEFWLTEGDQVRSVRGKNISWQYLPTVGIQPMWGRSFSAEDEKSGGVALLGFGLWQRLFGADTNLTGKTIVVNDQRQAVIGVMPPGFDSLHRSELWLPLLESRATTEPLQSRSWRLCGVIARLKPGVSLHQAQAELDGVAWRLGDEYPDDNADWGVRVSSLRRKLTKSIRPALPVFIGVAACILLIACANLGNLLLARAASRQKELAIRASVGAGRWRLARQLIAESLVLSLLGGTVGFLAVLWGQGLVARLVSPYMPRFAEINVDSAVFLFSLLVMILTGLVCGLAPVWQVWRADLNAVLKESGHRVSADRSASWLRSGLVVTELALAVVLLIGAGLALRSVHYLLHPGLDAAPGQVLAMEVELPKIRYPEKTQRLEFFEQLLARVRTLPHVQAAGAASFLEFSGGARSPIVLEGIPDRPDAPARWTWSCSVSPDFFRAMRLPLLQGRDFTAEDRTGAPKVAVITETMARRDWPGEHPLGKRFAGRGDSGEESWITVVGVVRDLRTGGVGGDWRASYYCPCYQSPYLGTIVVRAFSNPAGLAAQLQSLVRDLDKRLPPMSVQTLDEVVSDSASEVRMLGQILISLATLALVLAVVGTYGVIACTVAQRTHEFGVRIALGADRRDIALLVLTWGGRLALIGAAVGLFLAWGATRLMASFIEGVSPTDLPTFVGVVLLLCAVALLACLLPARRAMKVNPMEALRCD